VVAEVAKLPEGELRAWTGRIEVRMVEAVKYLPAELEIEALGQLGHLDYAAIELF